jgi:O-antigen/teichoic acid export membrane protein
LKNTGFGRAAFVRMLSGGVAIQAVLSASNFFVGLLLVRRTADVQYGYYVLITTVVLLSVILQGSFIQPPMTIRFTRSTGEARADLVGGLIQDQRRLFPLVLVVAAVILLVLQLAGKLNLPLAAIIVSGTAAVVAALRREFFRMVLFAYQRPNDVLRCDLVYCIFLVCGAFLSTLSAFSAAATAVTVAVASFIAGSLLSRALWRHEPWNRNAPRGKLREIAPEGALSSFGGGVHWLFSQGYNYLVAGRLDVSAVAALAATRLLVMPITLLSTGIGTLMLPTVSKWTHDHNAHKVLGRLALFATGIAAISLCYLVAMWLARDWIFDRVLNKHFANRDLLLATWAAISVITIYRDQLLHFLVARARFTLTVTATSISAIVSLSIGFTAMHSMGVIGALLGLLVGEVLNVAGIVIFSIRDARKKPHT